MSRRLKVTCESKPDFSFCIEGKSGHVLSDEMWRRTKEFFARHLQS